MNAPYTLLTLVSRTRKLEIHIVYGVYRPLRELANESAAFTFSLQAEEVLAQKIVIRREEP
jgi:hypothetical protein